MSKYEEAQPRAEQLRAMMTAGDHFHVITAVEEKGMRGGGTFAWFDRLDWWREAKEEVAEVLDAEPKPTSVWITETPNSQPCALCNEDNAESFVLQVMMQDEPYWWADK